MSKHSDEQPVSFARLACSDALSPETTVSARGVIYAELETAHQIERIGDMLEEVKTEIVEIGSTFRVFLSSLPVEQILSRLFG